MIKNIAEKIFGKSTEKINNEEIEQINKILEAESQRMVFLGSETIEIEDPSIKETIISANKNAYSIDAEQFV